MSEKKKWEDEKKLYNTIKEDFSGGNFRNNVSSDYEELKEFFLNSTRKKRLSKMGRIKRTIFIFWWLLQELLLKLNPSRRIVLLIGIILLFFNLKFGIDSANLQFSTGSSMIGGILILFVLMLELKDKILAKDELSAGRSVQNALMSKRSPKVRGWDIWLFTQPANDVGGDLVDIVNLGNGEFGISIADVSGKGLGAALLMAKLQTIIRALTSEYKSLPELFDKINSVFHKDILPNSFASMIYFKISEESGHVKMINAGHLPPIHVKKDGLYEFDKGDMALGLTPVAEFNCREINIGTDEYIVAFSDGVTEACNSFNNFFGLEKVKQCLMKSELKSSEHLGLSLLDELNNFIGDAKVHDDLSIVIIKKLND